MGVKYDYELDLSGLRDILKERGLEPGGAVQAFVDSEIIRLADPYVPFRTGALKDSAILNTVIGQGEIVYATPYAKRLYYHPEYNFNDAPMRGAHWGERMWADYGDEIIQGAAKMAGGTAK